MTKTLVLVVSLLALTALSCGFTRAEPTRIPKTPVPTLPPGAVVEELNIMNFQHADATVKAGTIVIWMNKDKPLHTVTHINTLTPVAIGASTARPLHRTRDSASNSPSLEPMTTSASYTR